VDDGYQPVETTDIPKIFVSGRQDLPAIWVVGMG